MQQRIALFHSQESGFSGLEEIENLELEPEPKNNAKDWISKEFEKAKPSFKTPHYTKIIWAVFGLMAIIGLAILPKSIRAGLIVTLVGVNLSLAVLFGNFSVKIRA